MRDSYERFFDGGYITKEQLFDFGLKETIYAPLDKATDVWDDLKERITSNKTVYIRGFGRGGNSTQLFFDFYKELYGNTNIKSDPTNNAEPTKLLTALTGYSKSSKSNHKNIRNYQVSHIFGKTKNVYMFTAPWNIVYIPKLLDPFTGHEAKGDMIGEFTKLFQEQGYKNFEPLIEDYNRLVTSPKFLQKLDESIEIVGKSAAHEEREINKLRKSVSEEFVPIVLDNII